MSSKYDAVSVRVNVVDDHWYMFSRYQLSRMLTFCKVPPTEAVRISLDVKKHLVDSEQLAIAQEKLEETVTRVMAEHGFGSAHTSLLPVMTAFYKERIPLVVFIGGDARSGKTTLAQQVSMRLNSTSLLNTEVLLDVVEAIVGLSADGAMAGHRIELDASSSLEQQREVDLVCDAIGAEVEKALNEGKVLVVEGQHVCFERLSQYLAPSFQTAHRCIVVGIRLMAQPLGEEYSDGWLHEVDVHSDDGDRLHTDAEGPTDIEASLPQPHQSPRLLCAWVPHAAAIPEIAEAVHTVLIQRIMDELEWRRTKPTGNAGM